MIGGRPVTQEKAKVSTEHRAQGTFKWSSGAERQRRKNAPGASGRGHRKIEEHRPGIYRVTTL